jgi:hypothetical protein
VQEFFMTAKPGTGRKAAKDTNTKPEKLSGYPHIEALLESEDFATVNKSFADAYQLLEKKAQDKGQGLAGRKKIKQAMQAYELTVELIRQLVALKYEMHMAPTTTGWVRVGG